MPGLVAWQVHQGADGIEVSGVDSQGHSLTRSTIHATTIDSAGTRLAEIVSESSTLRLISRNDQLLGHEMVGQASAATAPMVSDLRAYSGVLPYGCFLAALAAVLDCTAATLEDGLNPLADAACLVALGAYIDECIL